MTEEAGASPKRKGLKLKVLAGAAGLALVAQVIPVDRTNPPVQVEATWDSPRTKALAQRACFDCHSNETRWPWYSYVAPASWLVAYDVHEGRSEFNVSLADPGEADEAAEMVEKGEMPPWQYLLLHPEAQLSPGEKAELVAGLKATFGAEGSEHLEGREGRDVD